MRHRIPDSIFFITFLELYSNFSYCSVLFRAIISEWTDDFLLFFLHTFLHTFSIEISEEQIMTQKTKNIFYCLKTAELRFFIFNYSVSFSLVSRRKSSSSCFIFLQKFLSIIISRRSNLFFRKWSKY